MATKKKQKAKSDTIQVEAPGAGVPGMANASLAAIDSGAQKFSALSGGIGVRSFDMWVLSGKLAEREKELASREALLAKREKALLEREREIHLASLRPAPFPVDMYDMQSFIGRAPTYWHLETLVEVIIRTLVRHGRTERGSESSGAYVTLGRIARRFRTSPKVMTPKWILAAMELPEFRKAWDERPPRRTRGGTGDNDSIQVLFTFVELTMLSYDKHVEASAHYLPGGCPSRAERYSNPDEYLAGFLPFAKKNWEDGAREGAEYLTEKKLVSNTSGTDKPKRSFGLFKDQITKMARRNLANWRTAYPP